MGTYYDPDCPETEIAELERLRHMLLLSHSRNKAFMKDELRLFCKLDLTDEQLEAVYLLSYRIAMDAVLSYHAIAHLNMPVPPYVSLKE